MYKEEANKNAKLTNVISDLKLEIYSLKIDLKSSENKIENAVKSATKPLNEIDRLKNELEKKNKNNEKDYLIDKLYNQVNKDRRTNTYNHRNPSSNSTGGQLNHNWTTLTKEKIENKINESNLGVKDGHHLKLMSFIFNIY